MLASPVFMAPWILEWILYPDDSVAHDGVAQWCGLLGKKYNSQILNGYSPPILDKRIEYFQWFREISRNVTLFTSVLLIHLF